MHAATGDTGIYRNLPLLQKDNAFRRRHGCGATLTPMLHDDLCALYAASAASLPAHPCVHIKRCLH